ncbi:restriction endonuclease subunit S [Marinomonas flavescens]|uniref:restriction endonuclease subunit S n=1 Tax=Marinomonas flavescens TaxID=2529379 RepID=UPI001F0B5A9C|nr:restriction endonuclease subunit S [Marinomonas flavescens]
MILGKKVPEIRFHGFSHDWQNKEIGSILGETKRPVELLDNELYQLVTVKRRNEGVVPRATLKGKDILVKSYYGIKAGDYLISKRQVVHGANGIVPESLDNAVVSNEYLVLTDSNEITAKFWTVISKRPEMHKLFFISSYGVDIEKLVFDVTDWKGRAITIPGVAEQNVITDHFQKLDGLINQHQQKHDKLSSIKKAMLGKMFPKQGETAPEIRFKGFSGGWEEKPLSDIAQVIDPHPSHRAPDEVDNGVPFIGIGDISDAGLLDFKNVRIVPQDIYNEHSARYTIENGDFAYGRVASIGKIIDLSNNVGKKYTYSPTLAIVKPKSLYPAFLKSYLGTEVFKGHVDNKTSGSTRKSLGVQDFRNLPVLFPVVDEQTAIGNYFHKLYALINQHQQQITKLNNIKQACLSKMFV